MDEKINSRIEELKRNPPSRFLPVLFLLLAAAAVFLYRVAVTDPEWNASTPAAKAPAASVKARSSVAPESEPSRLSAARSAPPSQNPARPGRADVSAPSAVSERPSSIGGDQAKASAPKPAAAVSGAVADAYLERHINRSIPFVHRGEVREVTLTAFTRSTITVRRGNKSLTLERDKISPQQLELWK
jgi:hypothetical protein